MKIIKHLIIQKIKNSYRKIFYKKIVISNLIFCLSVVYIIIIAVKTSYLLKTTLLKNDINIEMFSTYLIMLVAVLDLIIKLIFSQIRIINIYPYLRLNIQRKKLANFVIIINHFNIINIIGLFLIIPITVLCIDCVELINLVLILVSLSIFFLFNNYISLIINIMNFRIHLLAIVLILSSLIFLVKTNFIVKMLNVSLEIRQIADVFFILLAALLSKLSHEFTKKEIIKMLYIN
jgi:hypothetical protein